MIQGRRARTGPLGKVWLNSCFLLLGGDPTGTGRGGTSIYGYV